MQIDYTLYKVSTAVFENLAQGLSDQTSYNKDSIKGENNL